MMPGVEQKALEVYTCQAEILPGHDQLCPVNGGPDMTRMRDWSADSRFIRLETDEILNISWVSSA